MNLPAFVRGASIRYDFPDTNTWLGRRCGDALDGAVGACELELTPGEIEAIEAPYVPHAVVGAVAENESPCIRARRLHTV